MNESVVDFELISDEELAELAMAADTDAPIADDAVPFGSTAGTAFALLPSWYMPAPSLRQSRGRVLVLAGVVLALLVIGVMGMCVTNGVPEPVWSP
jgi:putative Ca2+/H+ antiporter (TMEM165/GDT1 family)